MNDADALGPRTPEYELFRKLFAKRHSTSNSGHDSNSAQHRPRGSTRSGLSAAAFAAAAASAAAAADDGGHERRHPPSAPLGGRPMSILDFITGDGGAFPPDVTSSKDNTNVGGANTGDDLGSHKSQSTPSAARGGAGPNKSFFDFIASGGGAALPDVGDIVGGGGRTANNVNNMNSGDPTKATSLTATANGGEEVSARDTAASSDGSGRDSGGSGRRSSGHGRSGRRSGRGGRHSGRSGRHSGRSGRQSSGSGRQSSGGRGDGGWGSGSGSGGSGGSGGSSQPLPPPEELHSGPCLKVGEALTGTLLSPDRSSFVYSDRGDASVVFTRVTGAAPRDADGLMTSLPPLQSATLVAPDPRKVAKAEKVRVEIFEEEREETERLERVGERKVKRGKFATIKGWLPFGKDGWRRRRARERARGHFGEVSIAITDRGVLVSQVVFVF